MIGHLKIENRHFHRKIKISRFHLISFKKSNSPHLEKIKQMNNKYSELYQKPFFLNTVQTKKRTKNLEKPKKRYIKCQQVTVVHVSWRNSLILALNRTNIQQRMLRIYA